jgi:undecaprenyl-phosphate galactose phosphotransferase/putative colanic acid biosynthesis UDP-glucose lipid carrier transferase
MVMIGDFREMSALEPRDLLAFFGATKVNRLTLSREDCPELRASADNLTMLAVSNFVRSSSCREIWLALPWHEACRLEFVRDRLKTLPIAVQLLPDKRVRSLSNFASSARQRVLAIEIQRAPLSVVERPSSVGWISS